GPASRRTAAPAPAPGPGPPRAASASSTGGRRPAARPSRGTTGHHRPALARLDQGRLGQRRREPAAGAGLPDQAGHDTALLLVGDHVAPAEEVVELER